ncbi:hypothetical protein [Winogradskyella jejuensis]|uniref:Zinc-ribbon domain-containing protein n=1 Tax=Winogradskyella jejuensis TaxID=1089305 RepID=A0A1M5MQU9_9FLAO|nr:hypothetical protein [Winogradskyella jejuensis]SHG79596.1 hypothetical protein SAMN05444148_0966 [Winogradskyella jejuensis]
MSFEITFIILLIGIFSLVAGRILTTLFILNPKVNQADLDSNFKQKDLNLLAYVGVKKSEIQDKFESTSIFNKLFGITKYYKVLVYSSAEKSHQLLWAKASKLVFFSPIRTKIVEFVEEEEGTLLLEHFKEENFSISVDVINECPACSSKVEELDFECSKCGIAFR